MQTVDFGLNRSDHQLKISLIPLPLTWAWSNPWNKSWQSVWNLLLNIFLVLSCQKKWTCDAKFINTFQTLFRLLHFFQVKNKDLEDLKGPVAGGGIKVVQFVFSDGSPYHGRKGQQDFTWLLANMSHLLLFQGTEPLCQFKISGSTFCSGTVMIFLLFNFFICFLVYMCGSDFCKTAVVLQAAFSCLSGWRLREHSCRQFGGRWEGGVGM